jgi:hypothetical protein
MVVWEPRFQVHNCIQWGDYPKLCIKNIIVFKEEEGGGGTYEFKKGGRMWGPSIDDGFTINENRDGDGKVVLKIEPAELVTGGGKRRRSKSSKKRKSTKKSRKNRRKSKRRSRR